MTRPTRLALAFLIACHTPGAAPEASACDTPAADSPAAEAILLRGAIGLGLDPSAGIADGTAVDILIRDGVIGGLAASGGLADTAGATVVDLSGTWVAPAWIDSHVHLAYLPKVAEMAAGGVAAAVDMAAPLQFLNADHSPMTVLSSGPMVTAEGGYPTQSWGKNGFGLECADSAAATVAVDTLFSAGAKLIKLPVTEAPVLDAAALAAAAARAHALGLKVASHAVFDADAATAATAGADVLAHTPVGSLSEATLVAWKDRAVISTLAAFGGGPATLANFSALAAQGTTVLYGTDFGNTRTAGIDPEEIGLMVEAGLSGEAILASGTSTPAAYWGFSDLGSIGVGKAGSVLVLSADPRSTPATLASPLKVYIAGVQQ